MWKFLRFLILWSLLTAAVAGTAWWLGYLGFRPGIDRPAVLVFNTPIEIEAQFDADDGSRGAFDPVVPGDLRKWLAGHRGVAPRSLTVIITDSLSNSPGCRSMFMHEAVTAVTFTYMPNAGIPGQFVAAISPDGLELTFPGNAEQKAGSEFKLALPNASIRSVTIDGTTCELGPRSRVEIRQRK